jgi:hypothetical protein
MIPFFLNTSNGVRSIAAKGTVQALRDRPFYHFHWHCNVLIRNRREVSREECVLSMDRDGTNRDGMTAAG